MKFRTLKRQKKVKKTAVKYMYASYTHRVKAFITDMFMIYAPILYLIAYVFMDGKDDFQSSQLAPFIGVSIYGLIYAILLSKFGQTPGKKAYEIKVVDDKKGELISFFRAVCRFIAFLFTASTLLGLFLPFYRKDKKSLHDLICGTIVVIEKKD
ncbi:RDD family protein [Candidatus Sulfurimonas marisnigri]|uniref:RDD family protein n=1 Tax=Candidatus Sulfurimonas marisnigri TaxID=2740405 RepID=A0A7S7LZU8_9BACT|nr:RDD family protein [Candidatus Sulfurimonas marisnigri]QOY54472.1 RDD family protein [Candidatus Sulfurimonas marisnigri]